MHKYQRQIADANTQIARLERLSADSIWAHKASGLRGSLLRQVERVAQAPSPDQAELQKLADLTGRAYWILEQAAKEIPADKR
jgi:hypothetical protein